MTRKNGFIILEDYEVIRRCLGEGKYAYNWILWENEKCLFKKAQTKFECFNELYWGYILKKLFINCVKYDMAKQNNMIGVISKSFNHEYGKTYNIGDFIKKYRWNDYNYSSFNCIDLNNMYENIFEEFEDLIELKKKTVEQFIVQVLLGNSDLNIENMEICMTPNPKMMPLFDYGRYGKVKINRTSRKCFKFDYYKSTHPRNTLDMFLKKATKNEIEVMKELMERIKELKFKDIFEEIEYDIGQKVPLIRKKVLENKTVQNTIKIEKIMKNNW